MILNDQLVYIKWKHILFTQDYKILSMQPVYGLNETADDGFIWIFLVEYTCVLAQLLMDYSSNCSWY